jgi:hypothetical protein
VLWKRLDEVQAHDYELRRLLKRMRADTMEDFLSIVRPLAEERL